MTFKSYNLNTVAIKFTKLKETALAPVMSSTEAGAYDVFALEEYIILPGTAESLQTGLAFEIPFGYRMMIYSRSGHGFKNRVSLVNSVGILDSDYRGELRIGLLNEHYKDIFHVKRGDKIAQITIEKIIPVQFVEVTELNSTERGSGGFGSTGR